MSEGAGEGEDSRATGKAVKQDSDIEGGRRGRKGGGRGGMQTDEI